MANSVFDYINSINKKVGVMPRDNLGEFESVYNPYIVNLALCKFPDTILLVEDLVLRTNLTNLQHYEYLYYTVPKGNRWLPWNKGATHLDISIIQEVYKYSYEKAKDVVDLFTTEDLEKLKTILFQGGKN